MLLERCLLLFLNGDRKDDVVWWHHVGYWIILLDIQPVFLLPLCSPYSTTPSMLHPADVNGIMSLLDLEPSVISRCTSNNIQAYSCLWICASLTLANLSDLISYHWPSHTLLQTQKPYPWCLPKSQRFSWSQIFSHLLGGLFPDFFP